MGLLAVASAKGSPGVTTTSMLFGALWPRPSMVVECDAAGGDIAYRMPAADGRPLDPQQGLLSLAAAGRKSFHPGLVAQHVQQIVGGLDVLAGVSAPEQAAGLVAWKDFGRLFAALPGTDVIADLGRIGAATPQNALLASASAIVLVVDTVPSNVVHLRERMRRITESGDGVLGVPIHVVVVTAPKRTRAVREVREAIERSGVAPVAVHHLAEDPAGASFFLGQVSGDPSRTRLVRSAQPVVDELAVRLESFFVPGGPQQLRDDDEAAP